MSGKSYRKIDDLSFMTEKRYAILGIDAAEVQRAIGQQRDVNAQLLHIKQWLRQFDDSDLLDRLNSAIEAYNRSPKSAVRLYTLQRQFNASGDVEERKEILVKIAGWSK